MPIQNYAIIFKALADLVKKHIDNGVKCSEQLKSRCPSCINPTCFHMKKFFSSF